MLAAELPAAGSAPTSAPGVVWANAALDRANITAATAARYERSHAFMAPEYSKSTIDKRHRRPKSLQVRWCCAADRSSGRRIHLIPRI
jgi:hypothetical protein